MSARPATSQARPASALDRAYRLLARRPYFRAELTARLGAADCPEEEIEVAVARLAELGYLDDAALAQSEGERLAQRKGCGRARIRAELARRGAPEEALAAALAVGDGSAELLRARRAATAWGRRGGVEPAALARHLARKGFGRRVIFSILAERGGGEVELASGEEP